MDRVEEFLKELSELLHKHEVVLTSCGCCGGIGLDSSTAPFVRSIDSCINEIASNNEIV